MSAGLREAGGPEAALGPNQTVLLHPGRAWLPAPPATGPLRSSQTGLMRVSADLTVDSASESFSQRERPWMEWGFGGVWRQGAGCV